MKMHKNTKWIMQWADRMNKKFGKPKNPMDYDWIRKLSYYVDEAGNDYPSDYAIDVAKKWELSNWKEG